MLIALTTKNGGTIGGITFDEADIVIYDSCTGEAAILFKGADYGIDNNIDALHINDDLSLLISTRQSVIANGTQFLARDIFSFSNGTFAPVERLPQNINAAHLLPNGNYLLSATLPTVIGGYTTEIGDVVEWNPVTDVATLYFDHELFLTVAEGGIYSAGANIDSVHVLGNGNMLLSTTNTAQLGSTPANAVVIRQGTIYEYNPVTGAVTVYFDEALLNAGADIKAVHVIDERTCEEREQQSCSF